MEKFEHILKENYSAYLSSFKDTSFDKANGVYLCSDETRHVYNFDEIVRDLYPENQPASFDALFFDGFNVYCVEFKNERPSGIKNKEIQNKLQNSHKVINDICDKHDIQRKDYKFIFSVVFKAYTTNSAHKRGVAKNYIHFGLKRYKREYFDEILTSDINRLTAIYSREFTELLC